MSLSPQIRRSLKRIVKRGLEYRTDPLAERAALKAKIIASTENGLVAYCGAGTDCDGYRWHGCSLIPAPVSVFAFERELDHAYSYLDGPGWYGVASPSQAKEMED